MTIQLRPYQREALDQLYRYWQNDGGNGLIVLPTGAGKSLVLASLVKELLHQFPTLRIACVTHVKELIVQNYQELIRLWPEAPAGIFSAGVGRRDTHNRIIFCGIQSVWNKTDLLGQFDVLIVDECHLIPRDTTTTYGRFIDRLKTKTPDMRIVGLTATPYRMSTGRLDQGEGRMFDNIVYEAGVVDLIEAGYLSPLISKASLSQVDLTNIGTRQGDFIPADLEKASMKGDLVDRAVAELVQHGKDRRAWLAFCSGVNHAKAVRDAIRGHGISAETVDGAMDRGQRDSVIRRFRNGEIRCLTSVNVLSIGFNVPHVDLIGLMRATKSTGMYIQQVGRGFRTAPGKANALILDFARVVRMHGPVDAVSVFAAGSGSGKMEKPDADTVRAKECPSCQSLAALNARECMVCGHEWAIEEKPKHDAEAEAEIGILSTEQVAPKQLPVVNWQWERYEKPGSPDSLLVTYFAGITTHREWWGFEHHGSWRDQACQKWVQHGGAMPFPKSVAEAMDRRSELAAPTTISLKPDPKNRKYNIIVARSFAAERRAA